MSFRGDKAALPCKPCVRCGRPMIWRQAFPKGEALAPGAAAPACLAHCSIEN